MHISSFKTFETVFLLGSDIETENFLRQRAM